MIVIGCGPTVHQVGEEASERPLAGDRGVVRIGGDVEQQSVVAVPSQGGDVAHDVVVVGFDAVVSDLCAEEEVIVRKHVFMVRRDDHHVKR